MTWLLMMIGMISVIIMMTMNVVRDYVVCSFYDVYVGFCLLVVGWFVFIGCWLKGWLIYTDID